MNIMLVVSTLYLYTVLVPVEFGEHWRLADGTQSSTSGIQSFADISLIPTFGNTYAKIQSPLQLFSLTICV